MVVSLIIFALLGILGLVSAGESAGGEKRKMLLPFWKMGVWTARHTGLQKMGQGNRKRDMQQNSSIMPESWRRCFLYCL